MNLGSVLSSACAGLDDFAQRLTRFYAKYNPDKLDEIDGTVLKYAGKENKLFKALIQKYGPEPTAPESKQQPDDESWDDAAAGGDGGAVGPAPGRGGGGGGGGTYISTDSCDPAAAALRNNLEATGLSYAVRATKGGGVPCAVEKRKHHKVVVVTNVEGDTKALLSDLQKCLGTGGVMRKAGTVCQEPGSHGALYKTDQIEISGEKHEKKVREHLVSSGCIVGASGKVKAEVMRAMKKKGKQVGSGKARAEKILKEERAKKEKRLAAFDPARVTLDVRDVKGKMKPNDIKGHLKARGLSTQGSKKELIARLCQAIANPAPPPPAVDEQEEEDEEDEKEEGPQAAGEEGVEGEEE
eukprot:g1386.t1